MLSEVINRVFNKTPNACKTWANVEDDGADLLILPKDGGPTLVLDANRIVDGLESFAEFNLRNEDAKFREVSRAIQREQWGRIKLNNKIVNAIVQHGVFGEVVF